MSEFWYVCSNGRCGTQFLARQLSLVGDKEHIVHEVLPLQFAARKVFRDPEALYSQIGRTPQLQAYLVHMANMLRTGRRNVYCGWPAFAWLDYFAERYGDAFRFVHLVRNPYFCAASHATHQPMRSGSLNAMEAACKLFGTDPNVKYRQFADRYHKFGTFERQLFHWLEVTAYVLEHADSPHFAALYRFEDITAPQPGALNRLMSLLLGRQVAASQPEPFDRVHRAAPVLPDFHVDPDLRAAVDDLALGLGYSADALSAALNARQLGETYARKRFDLPCDSRIRVTVNK